MLSADAARRELADYLGMRKKPQETDKLTKVLGMIADFMRENPHEDLWDVVLSFSQASGIPFDELREAINNQPTQQITNKVQ